MTVYVVLFRGVGGATQLPTAKLRESLTAAGFENVATYINSGNAIVKTQLAALKCHAAIAALAKSEFGFGKEILLRTAAEWAKAVEANPFPEAEEAPTTVHLFALAAAPKPPAVQALTDRLLPTERIGVHGKTMYFHAPKGFGTSKTPPLVDRLLGVASTARNWNTAVKLRDMAKAAE